MKCHYEVLNVARDVDKNDIKSAYRKMALKCHPDKNLEDPEDAKEQFQLVQQAYDVLSDQNERAWYDKHREQILRGKDKEYTDKSLDLFQYFRASCYKGFQDDPKGFYTVYSDVFKTIATEDIEFMESENQFEMIPSFGNSESNYDDEVGPFYAYWQSYCTKKSYAWLSPHIINEIRDRRNLKMIEKENKKVQQKARQERNEEVRTLVTFVRKRDKRVKAHRILLEEKAELNRSKQAKNRIEQISKRQNEIKDQLKFQVENDDYVERISQLEAAYVGSFEKEDGYIDGYEEICIIPNEEKPLELEEDDLYCVACNKLFKHDKSFKNHQFSKKHTENIEKLKLIMLLDDQNYINAISSSSNNSEDEANKVTQILKQKKK